ncbi:6-phosphofructokinase [Mesomycoplasma lagogenitalium]|uniref:ATP-dependent 6-phosphofructokinase n=1 Tax=Mesomycoplasma lagogenitalium TaxID=171286 RepID=A0ABY8LXN4_9BACT|nr:6-phosphofructokinase [Mesomycoplasma lagogenitalium]WGI36897.1 6-phosphofructokinase [Mesomycoplasma lagogenitalium]
METKIKKIAILTSGGDAPGMNNAVRAVVKQALANDIEPFLVYEGYKGLYYGNIVSAKNINVDAYVSKGGTFIYSARFPEFKELKTREKAKDNLLKMGIDALVVIGGDGSYMGAQLLHELGIKTVGLPGTIDNDITSSDFTIGYDTALNTIVDAVEKIRDTSDSHNRFLMVEVMGHGSGDLALYSGLATGAEIIITNEQTMTKEEIAEVVKNQIYEKGKRSVIAIVSEFIYPNLKEIAAYVQEKTNVISRAMALEYIQRGGRPSAQERIWATLMGIKAVDFLKEGKSGIAIGVTNSDVVATPILKALQAPRKSNKAKTIKFNKLNQA